MGLNWSDQETRELKEFIESKGGKISVWKYLNLEGSQFISPYEYRKWKAGLNKSGRSRLTRRYKLKHNQMTPAEANYHRIDHGFHVYTSYSRARYHAASSNPVIVRFEATLDNFIAAGAKRGKSFHAVFSQLILPKSVVTRILKKHGSTN